MSESNPVYTSDFNGRLSQPGAVRVGQSGIRQLESRQEHFQGIAGAFMAKVDYVYPDRGTVDVSVATEKFPNVPILTQGGKDSDGGIWGDVHFPQSGDYVLVLPLDPMGKKKVVLGTIFPYLMQEWKDQQNPVNSTNKQYTKKLLDSSLDPKVWRKIFPSGTTIEVKKDGTILVETPSGTSVVVDEANHKLTAICKNSTAECKLELDPANGFTMEDANGNKIVSASTHVTINDNFQVDQ